MDFPSICDRLEAVCAGAIVERVVAGAAEDGAPKDAFLVLAADRLRDAMTALRDDAELRFDLLICLGAVDYPEVQPKAKKKADPVPDPIPGRFEVVYHLLSTIKNQRCVVKIKLPHDEKPVAPTVQDIYPTANWHEREAWDLMGIHFDGHPDMRRVLCALDWVGHPLRKDYVFPKEYHGISAE